MRPSGTRSPRKVSGFRWWGAAAAAGLVLAAGLALSGEAGPSTTLAERARAYTRGIEFDFLGWSANAAWGKLQPAGVGAQAVLGEQDRSQLVRGYFDLRRQLEQVEAQIATAYGDPAVADPDSVTREARQRQTELRAALAEREPLAEAILQEQVAAVFAEQGLAVGGQLFPPIAFHFTALPLALVISPRDRIEQAAIQMIDGDLPLDRQVGLENRVARGLDVSALVTPVGGIGIYPTMVAESSDLNWIVSVVAHEWTHNYLTLRPLGVLYDTSPELRTLNETVAELVGDEIGARVMVRYYPDLAPPPAPWHNTLGRAAAPAEAAQPAGFDFRAEMRTTRVHADALLAAGQISAAEAYLELRRQFFWENGYHLRKLNQAYFAFYGAYNASPGGGASGADPIGPAVRLLRRRSADVAAFLTKVAWYTNVTDLRQDLGLP